MKNIRVADMQLGAAFNNMPGREAVYKSLSQNDVWGNATVVDTDKSYWANKADTLVIAIGINTRPGTVLGVAKFVSECLPDEFDYQYDGATDQYVCRFWWD